MATTGEVGMEQSGNNTDVPGQQLLKEINTFKVIFNKQKYDVSFDLHSTVAQLKEHLHSVIGVPKEMQKVMVKGLAKDDKSLKECGITSGSKVMVIGSTFDDVLALVRPSAQTVIEEKQKSSPGKEPLSQQKLHLKVIDKGLPEDVLPGIKNVKVTFLSCFRCDVCSVVLFECRNRCRSIPSAEWSTNPVVKCDSHSKWKTTSCR